LDVERLAPGQLWLAEIEAALQSSKCMILYVGREGVRNWVDRELRVALDRSVRDPDFRLIPILGPGALAQDLPLFLRQYQWLDSRQGLGSPDPLGKLLAAISGGQGKPVSPLPLGDSPFRGLLSYHEEDALLFYGRDKETEDLVAKVSSCSFLALTGDSGSGKSSLIRAGLIPALHRGRARSGNAWVNAWRIAVCRPGDTPFRELAEASAQLEPSLTSAERMTFISEMNKQLSHGSDGLRNGIVALGLASGVHRLLVVDQFEEIFTLCSDKSERLRYIDTLLDVARSHSASPVHVIIVIRADFYSYCWQHGELIRRINANQYATPRMTRLQLCEAIEKPAALAGVSIETGLLEILLDDAADEPGSLPLLEHALEQLWSLKNGTTLTHNAYRQIGRLSGSLQTHAEATYNALDASEQEISRKMLLKLVRLGEESSRDTRRRRLSRDLVAGNPDIAPRVLQKLADARLLVLGDNVELAHEALLVGWPRYQRWIAQNRDAMRIEKQLSEVTEEWIARNCSRDVLYRGTRLAEAEEWANSRGDVPPETVVFLQTSREEQHRELAEAESLRQHELDLAQKLQQEAEARARTEHRLSRRNWRFALAFLAVAVGAISFAAFASIQLRTAQSRAFAARAEKALKVDPIEALVLAIEATQRQGTYEATAALFKALEAPHVLAVLQHPDRVLDAVFSHDGKLLFTTCDDNKIRIWDTETGRELHVLTGHQKTINSIAVSSDDHLIATASADKTTRLWNVQGARLATTFIGHAEPVNSVEFSADGKTLLTASSDGTARTWDVASGRELLRFNGHAGLVSSATFSQDGRVVVTAGSDHTPRAWDAHTGQILFLMQGHEKGVTRARFSPKGATILTVGEDGARVWDANTGRQLFLLTNEVSDPQFAEYSPDGERIVTAGSHGTAAVWNAHTGEKARILSGHRDDVYSATFSPDGEVIVTGANDDSARIWDVPTGLELATLLGHHGLVTATRVSSDGKQIATVSWDGTVRLWSSTLGSTLYTIERLDTDFCEPIFSPDGKMIAVPRDGRVQVARGDNGSPVLDCKNVKNDVRDAVFSPDSRLIATADYDGKIRVWNIKAGAVQCSAESEGKGGDQQIYFSRDGATVAVTGSHTHVWNTSDCSPTSERQTSLWDDRAEHMAGDREGSTSPDGKYSLTFESVENEPIGVDIWDAKSGKKLYQINGHQPRVEHAGYQASFSPDSLMVLTSGLDLTARLWSVADGSEIEVLRGHEDVVRDATFSPDGKMIVTTGDDHTIRIWETATAHELFSFSSHGYSPVIVRFSPDGSRLYSASFERDLALHVARRSSVLVWSIRPEDMLTIAESRLPVTLSRAERGRMIAGKPERTTAHAGAVTNSKEGTDTPEQ
jgi:WD40 repeat protein